MCLLPFADDDDDGCWLELRSCHVSVFDVVPYSSCLLAAALNPYHLSLLVHTKVFAPTASNSCNQAYFFKIRRIIVCKCVRRFHELNSAENTYWLSLNFEAAGVVGLLQARQHFLSKMVWSIRKGVLAVNIIPPHTNPYVVVLYRIRIPCCILLMLYCKEMDWSVAFLSFSVCAWNGMCWWCGCDRPCSLSLALALSCHPYTG